MSGDDNVAGPISAVTVKLLDFWTINPALWFVQVETVFESSNVTRDHTKYIHCLAKLPEKVLESIADIIAKVQPNTEDGYQQLKLASLAAIGQPSGSSRPG